MAAKAFLARVFGLGERRVGVADDRDVAHRAVAAGRIEQQRLVARRHMAIRHRRQRLDIDLDRFERVLGLPLLSATTTAIGSPT